MKHHDSADDASGRLPGPEVIAHVEDRLRTAFRAKAREISAPPPLELRPRRGAAGRLASSTWTVPVAAAIAVLAIVLGALVAADALPGRQTPPAGPIQTKVPPYYVALIASQPRSPYSLVPALATAVVRATSTGALIASVQAPRPYGFVSVTAAADDRSFVLYAVGPSSMKRAPNGARHSTYVQRFFMLRINPASPAPAARARLTALPRAGIASQLHVQAMALSPSGQSLAVIFANPSRAILGVATGQLTIFDLADGTRRTWIRPVCGYRRCAPGPVGAGSIYLDPSEVQLSWRSDGRSVLFLTGPQGSQLRLLDVDAPGRNLIADSHALPVRTAFPNWTNAVITPDGQSVLVEYSTTSGNAVSRNFLLRLSARTGKTDAVIQVARNARRPDHLLWTNYDGSKIIVVRSEPAPLGELNPSGQAAGVYSGHRYTPIPWPAGVVDAAW